METQKLIFARPACALSVAAVWCVVLVSAMNPVAVMRTEAESASLVALVIDYFNAKPCRSSTARNSVRTAWATRRAECSVQP